MPTEYEDCPCCYGAGCTYRECNECSGDGELCDDCDNCDGSGEIKVNRGKKRRRKRAKRVRKAGICEEEDEEEADLVVVDFMKRFYTKEREFQGMLFYGNGDHALIGEAKLYHLLQEALSHISGLQQPLMATMDTEGWDEVLEDGWGRVETIVRDIAAALTGKEIEFMSPIEDEDEDDEEECDED